MISRKLHGQAMAIGLISIVSACESQPTTVGSSFDREMEARGAFISDLQRCTRTHGYDPNAAGLPENALAPNELPWRQCAYDAAHRYGQAHPAVSDRYEQLIAEDQQMTAAIQKGTLTRTERRTRVEQLLEQIRVAEEDAQIPPSSSGKDATETIDRANQQYQLTNVVNGARGFSQ